MTWMGVWQAFHDLHILYFPFPEWFRTNFFFFTQKGATDVPLKTTCGKQSRASWFPTLDQKGELLDRYVPLSTHAISTFDWDYLYIDLGYEMEAFFSQAGDLANICLLSRIQSFISTYIGGNTMFSDFVKWHGSYRSLGSECHYQ